MEIQECARLPRYYWPLPWPGPAPERTLIIHGRSPCRGRAAKSQRVERSIDKNGKVTEFTYNEQDNVVIKKVNAGTPQEAVWLFLL